MKRLIAFLSVLIVGLWGCYSPDAPEPSPAPRPSPTQPVPRPPTKPKPRPCPGPWGECGTPVGVFGGFGKIVVGGPLAPDGKTEVQVDFPVDQRTKNVGGRDGSGLCVFSSIGHSARWQNELRLSNFQLDMRKELGGGYPSKVDEMIKKYGDGAPYIQYEGKDPSVLELAVKTGRMPSVTYDGRDPHYSGRIAHMVNLVYLDAELACVLDNNFVGERDLVWMSRQEFMDRWIGGRSGWAVILLYPPPPPVPLGGR